MKIKVLSLATSNINDYAKYSTAINAAYCKKNGYDFECKTQAYKERPAAWSKIQFLLENINKGYEWIMWIDADAHFNNFNKRIEDFIGGDEEFIFSQVNGLLNSGVFLVRCCEASEITLQKVWDMEQHINHVWWENKAFIELWDMDFLSLFSYLDGAISDTTETAQPGSFTIHLPGTTLQARTTYFKNIYNDKKRHIIA